MQPAPAFQAGEHDARELEVAMYAAFVLLQRAQKLCKAHLPAEQASYAAVGAS